MKDQNSELPPLPEPDQYTWYSRNLVESIRKRAIELYHQGGNAKHQYEKAMAGSEELDPIERLRFFCSIAMRTQDWLDTEPFFEDLVADRQRIAELEAARIAYASEFPPNKDGEPDVGSIHENIRKLKTECKRRGELVAWAFNTPSLPYTFFTTKPDQDNIKREKLIPLYTTPQPAEPVKRFQSVDTSYDKPQIGSIWRHYNGNLYTVEGFTNEHTERHEKYPVTICYRGENGHGWSRPLSRWFSSMSFVRAKQDEPVKVPSDDDLFAIHDEYFPTMVLGHENYLSFARALLARYGGGTP